MMKKLWLVALFGSVGVAQAEMLFTENSGGGGHAGHGAGATAAQGGHGGHGAGRGPATMLQDGLGASIQMVTPTLESLPVDAGKDGRTLQIPRTGIDSYHLLLAERRDEKVQEAAMRYIYGRGKPSGRSPSELLAHKATVLELIPAPLPREHWRYESGEKANFIVRFNGEPLADTWVGLSSSNGSSLEATSDHRGRVSFTLPEDFSRVVAGRQSNPPAEFVVRTGTYQNGMLYRTNLSAAYHVNPLNWQSNGVGLFMLGAGFVSGLVMMRRRGEG